MSKKTALITGASAGIGKATATLLAKQGYNLILTARRLDLLETLAQQLVKTYGINVLPLQLDVRDKKLVFDVIENLGEEWRSIDTLINNAGLASGLNTIDEGDTNDWDTMIDTNVKGLLYVTRAVVPLMKTVNSGHIINIGSIAGKEVYMNGNVYCATKHAVDALNKAMRLELSKFPIRVTAIHPGAVETEFSIVRFHGNEERAAKVYDGFENLVAEDIADAIWYALSRPQHININELTIMPTAQPVASVIHRKNSV
jgi:3-hydroxy acid dehydrogenase / malonic semialdehyde reductase